MKFPEILTLRQSDAFARRLFDAARALDTSVYALRRRVNWSHRYHARFYQNEAQLFTSDAKAYTTGRCTVPPSIDDVFTQKLGGKSLLAVVVKVFAHWLFRIAGALARPKSADLSIYRKAYVDDIELVFDPEQPSVLRAVYPFPVSVRRQIRYIRTLRQRGLPWVLTGNPYGLADLLRLMRRRDLRSLQRMESRAQIRDAQSVASRGFRVVQLSDEFNLGSLDFARSLARRGVTTVNSAHGAGKYLPVHAYSEFHVLTGRQQAYYTAAIPCHYVKRVLNEKAAVVAVGKTSNVQVDDNKVNFVFLSGTTSYSVGEDSLIRNEAAAFRRFGSLADVPNLRLLFRPHPNCHSPIPPDGFQLLPSLEAVNARQNTIFASFASTCQIDPAFKGRKILLRGEFMFPEIWFDDTEEMMTVDDLVDELCRLSSTQSLSIAQL